METGTANGVIFIPSCGFMSLPNSSLRNAARCSEFGKVNINVILLRPVPILIESELKETVVHFGPSTASKHQIAMSLSSPWLICPGIMLNGFDFKLIGQYPSGKQNLIVRAISPSSINWYPPLSARQLTTPSIILFIIFNLHSMVCFLFAGRSIETAQLRLPPKRGS